MALLKNSTNYSPVDNRHTWRPGKLRRFPWLGSLAILGALLGIIAAISIVVSSNGALIADWKYAPTVWLSIAYTISNLLLSSAFSYGVTLSWWNKAMKQDTVVGDLHRYYAYGTNPLAAVSAGRHFNFIAFALLFVTLTPINGPLLQRSSTVGIKTISSTAALSIPAARNIYNATGWTSGRAATVALFTNDFNAVVQAYYRNDSILARDTGCAGDLKCSGMLEAAGLAVNCSSTSASFDASPKVTSSGQVNTNGTDVFQSFFENNGRSSGNISLSIQYKNNAATTGQLVVRNCSLQTATVQYPVVIDGNSSTISLDPNSTIFDDMVVRDGPVDDYDGSPSSSLIGGYTFALSTRFNSVFHLQWVGAVGYQLDSTGPTAPQFAVITNASNIEDAINSGSITFNDPTMYLLSQARELMFRTAIAQGNDSNVAVLDNAFQTRNAGVYISHYGYLSAAVAISFIALGIVLATYYEYWQLGREVSMSPIEIARAFNAPILAEGASNATAGQLVGATGTKPVRYGILVNNYRGFNDKPNRVSTADQTGFRLEIADPRMVKSLRRYRRPEVVIDDSPENGRFSAQSFMLMSPSSVSEVQTSRGSWQENRPGRRPDVVIDDSPENEQRSFALMSPSRASYQESRRS